MIQFAKRKKLSPEEINEVKRLALFCKKHEGINMAVPLNFSMLEVRNGEDYNDFLYYIKGELAGFAGMYSMVGPDEVEMAAMVHPHFRRQGLGSKLMEEAVKECRSRGVKSLLAINERKSTSGQCFLTMLGTELAFSEHALQFSGGSLQPVHPIRLQQAGHNDRKEIKNVLMDAFGDTEQEALQLIDRNLNDPQHSLYKGVYEEEIIGTVTTTEDNGAAYISAFAVLQKKQGRGFGRKILSSIIQKELDNGTERIYIDVETE